MTKYIWNLYIKWVSTESVFPESEYSNAWMHQQHNKYLNLYIKEYLPYLFFIIYNNISIILILW